MRCTGGCRWTSHHDGCMLSFAGLACQTLQSEVRYGAFPSQPCAPCFPDLHAFDLQFTCAIKGKRPSPKSFNSRYSSKESQNWAHSQTPRARQLPKLIEKFGSPGKIRTCNPSVNSAIQTATHTNQKLQVPIKPGGSRPGFCNEMEHTGSSSRTEFGQFILARAEVCHAAH
jgi:hypothetical protein